MKTIQNPSDLKTVPSSVDPVQELKDFQENTYPSYLETKRLFLDLRKQVGSRFRISRALVLRLKRVRKLLEAPPATAADFSRFVFSSFPDVNGPDGQIHRRIRSSINSGVDARQRFWMDLFHLLEVHNFGRTAIHVREHLPQYQRALSAMGDSVATRRCNHLLATISESASSLKTQQRSLNDLNAGVDALNEQSGHAEWESLLHNLKRELQAVCSREIRFSIDAALLRSLDEFSFFSNLKHKVMTSVLQDSGQWTFFRFTFLPSVTSGSLASHIRKEFNNSKNAKLIEKNRKIGADFEGWQRILDRCLANAQERVPYLNQLLKDSTKRKLSGIMAGLQQDYSKSENVRSLFADLQALVHQKVNTSGFTVDVLSGRMKSEINSLLSNPKTDQEIVERGSDFETKLREFVGHMQIDRFKNMFFRAGLRRVALSARSSRVADNFPRSLGSNADPLAWLYGSLVVANLTASVSATGVEEKNVVSAVYEENKHLIAFLSLKSECIKIIELMEHWNATAKLISGGDNDARSKRPI